MAGDFGLTLADPCRVLLLEFGEELILDVVTPEQLLTSPEEVR